MSGVLPYSRLRNVRAKAWPWAKPCCTCCTATNFPELERVSPELVQRLVSLMSDRARDEARGQERDDKLRALGKLSAGLAHELNNPAAAIARAAQALAEPDAAQPALLLRAGAPLPRARSVGCPHRPGRARPAASLPAPALGPGSADREDELADWLEAQGVPDGYRLAAGLLEAGLTMAALAPVAAASAARCPPRRPAWLEGQLTTLQLIHDVQEASGRISKLVADVKTYSHMDRGGGFAPLDVAAGLDSTLNMLGFRCARRTSASSATTPPTCRPIRGQASSLNQVWTNLHRQRHRRPARPGRRNHRAHPARGRLRAGAARRQRPRHPGRRAAPHLRALLHHQAAGEGSGLGLDIAQRIIRQHDGPAGGAAPGRAAPNSAPGCR